MIPTVILAAVSAIFLSSTVPNPRALSQAPSQLTLQLQYTDISVACNVAEVEFSVLGINLVSRFGSYSSTCACPQDTVAVAANCTGGSCNEISWKCSHMGDTASHFFHVEDSQFQLAGETSNDKDPVFCPKDMVATQISCAAKRCGNMKLGCAPVYWTPGRENGPAVRFAEDLAEGACKWTDWFENNSDVSVGTCPPQTFVRGLQAKGPYSSSLSLYCCTATLTIERPELPDTPETSMAEGQAVMYANGTVVYY